MTEKLTFEIINRCAEKAKNSAIRPIMADGEEVYVYCTAKKKWLTQGEYGLDYANIEAHPHG